VIQHHSLWIRDYGQGNQDSIQHYDTKKKIPPDKRCLIATLMTNELLGHLQKDRSKRSVSSFLRFANGGRRFERYIKNSCRIGYRELNFFRPYPFSLPGIIEGWKPIAAQLGIAQMPFNGHL